MGARATVALLSIALGAGPVQAQQASVPDAANRGAADSGQTSPTYRELIDGAVTEYGLGHFEEARALFARAHAMRPNARTLRGLGVASYELRSYLDSVQYLEAALASQANPLKGRLRANTQRLLDRARTFVGTLALQVEPTNAHIHIDGRQIPQSQLPHIQLDLGEHELEATAQGYHTRRVRFKIRDSEPRPLEVHLRPHRFANRQDGQPKGSAAPALHPALALQADTGRAPTTAALTNDPSPETRDGSIWESPWLWTGVGAGLVVAIVGTTLALSAGGGSSASDDYGGSTDVVIRP